jgi:hypothetical protein
MTMLPHDLVWEMMMAYEGGLSLAAVARHFGRERRRMNELFIRRGFALRPPPPAPPQGRFVAGKKLTEAQITKIIAGMKRIACPPELHTEWRSWPMARRVAFIARVRAKLNSPKNRPAGPFSKNVIPWEYGTPAAMELAYDGPSQKAGCKVKLQSQGLIWRGRLFSWVWNNGYLECVQWTAQQARPLLHHLIWEEHNGRPVPDKHQVIFRDGNKNNHAPANLALRSMNDCCRINQAAALQRKSREETAVLLKNSQQGKQNANHKTFQRIASGCYRGKLKPA